MTAFYKWYWVEHQPSGHGWLCTSPEIFAAMMSLLKVLMLTRLKQFHYFSGQVWSILQQTAVRSKSVSCSSPSSTWRWDSAHSSSDFSYTLVLEENRAYKSAVCPELPHPHPWAGQPGATRQAVISWDADGCLSTLWLSSTCVIEMVEARAQRLWDLSLRIYQLLSLLMFWAIQRVMSMVRTRWSRQELINWSN